MNKPREINAYQDYINTLPPVSSFFDYNAANKQIIEQDQGEQLPRMFQAPEPQVNDYTRMNAEIAANQKANPTVRPTPDQVLEDIYKLPEPKYDQARQDRIKKLTRVNAMGEGLKAMGDIFSLSQGAIVNRRQDDGKNEKLYGMFQGYDDDFARRMDQHNRDEFNLKLQQIREGKQDKWREEDMNFRRSESLRSQYNTDRQFGAMELDRDERRKDREQGRELQEKNMERMAEQFEKQHGLAWAKYNLDIAKLAKANQDQLDKNVFKLFDQNTGQVISNLDTRGGVDALLAIIIGGKENTEFKNELELLKGQFGEGLTTETKRYLVQKYWQQIPEAREWVNEYSKTDEQRIQEETARKTSQARQSEAQKQQDSYIDSMINNPQANKQQISTGGYY